MDAVRDWLRAPSVDSLDCGLILAAWNLFKDVSRSVPDAREFRELDDGSKLPLRLFWGDATEHAPPEQGYELTDEHAAVCAKAMQAGLRMLRRAIVSVE